MGLKLMAELGLDGAGFEAGFKRAEGFAHGAAEGIKSLIIQGVGIATAEEAIRRTVETAKELVETSERLAIAPEQLQIMRQAAKDSGVEFEKLAQAFEKVNIAREKALMPGQEGFNERRAFMAAGINRQQLQSAQPLELLQQIAGRANPEQIGIIFRELGLKAFGPLIPLLKTNFDELGAKMKKLGAIMDTETAVKLKVLSNQFSLIGKLIAVKVGPALISFTELLIRAYIGLHSAWTYVKNLFGSKEGNKAMLNFMQSQSGFGGPNASQEAKINEGGLAMNPEALDKKFRDEARDAAKEDAFQGIEWLRSIENKFKAMAEELNNPKPPDFTTSTIPEKLSKKALEMPSDSLTRVGNFLGGGQLEINRIAEKQVYWLEKIYDKMGNNTGFSRVNSSFPSMMGPHFPHS